MTVNIRIAIDNAAFEDPEEIRRILEVASDKVALWLEERPFPSHASRLVDINGNSVGIVALKK